ncbi:cytochrome c [Solimicrobium silvestre]|uniref:Cytochrome c n=1 Tax=Solimicrobium silvestre TaxID=2099400 RepID=A0A2S9H4C8_9BURK|nr:cytochrome c [Solimicrobium silvestre]PRC94842.1 Cytochrome c [Solimicrobium silvestre]
MKRLIAAFIVTLLAFFVISAYVIGGRDTAHIYPSVNVAESAAQQIQRGSYLLKAGNCMACHTARGAAEFSGGRMLPTTFGQFYTPNITSDVKTGIGAWSPDEFWRALHDGKGRDGRLLYPAFPYTEYTKVSRADSDAMFAALQSLPAVSQVNREHELAFPFNQRSLLLFWRALYFTPQVYQADPQQSAEWNRGAYLVQGLGHCATCHTARNSLGGSVGAALAGAEIPELNWYATSLISNAESGHVDIPVDRLVQRMQSGVSEDGRVYGLMTEVVKESLQYLEASDIQAMAVYLKSQQKKDQRIESEKVTERELAVTMARGEKIYKENCVECHQANGKGAAPAYPALAGSRLVNLASTTNITRIILNGGFSPSTQHNPEPFGMPPFAQILSSQEIADVANFVRNSWGNQGSLLISSEVDRYRGQASH